MKLDRQAMIPRLVFVLAVALMILCVTLSILTIEDYAKDECFDNIEESAQQVTEMFSHTMLRSYDQLALFADILAANSTNPPALLEAYMENFCSTQNFSAVCACRPDGKIFCYGDHPHRELTLSDFDAEVEKSPYLTDMEALGETRSQQFVRLTVPVVRNGEAIAVLSGFIPLDAFPDFFSSSTYGGKGQVFIVDGATGDFLLNEHARIGADGREQPLGNLFTERYDLVDSKADYSLSAMETALGKGGRGYHIFKDPATDLWYYTYYAPLGINNWSMLLTIDEPTAFETYYGVRSTVSTLLLCMAFLTAVLVLVLLYQIRQRRLRDSAELHKADYLNAVQGALITAHTNPDFVDQALKIMAKEVQAETVLLLTFDAKRVSTAYFWPSEDRVRAMALVGMDVQETFPALFDALASNESLYRDAQALAGENSATAGQLFRDFDVRDLLLVPVADNAGMLKGAIAAINLTGSPSPELLECVTRDFFMAITNLENHNIIKKMGAIDYLTGVKNRNSFEAESAGYETLSAEELWCAFIDVNGLHELNNTKGHQAGDALLCAVAEAVRKVFGPEFSYRLGGDEFVAFRINASHEEMMNCKYRLLDELDRKGCSVSVGFEKTGKNENNVFDVEKVMAAAEAIMYREKWKYYQEHGLSPQRKTPAKKPPAKPSK